MAIDATEQIESKSLVLSLFRDAFSSLRHRNFRMYFSAQSVSLIGMWMHTAAISWLIYDLTGSDVMLGQINALSTLPMVIVTPIVGVIADHYSRRRLVLIPQFLSMILAFILGAIVFADIVRPWHLAVFVLVIGTMRAVDVPARNAMMVDLVGRDDLRNAIALHSSLFNLARVLGPAVAGVVMASVGTELCFFINGFTFMPIIAVLAMINLRENTLSMNGEKLDYFESFAEPLRYLLKTPRLLLLMVQLGFVATFLWSYNVLLPVFTSEIYHFEEKGYGFILSVNGVGALAGALTVAALSKRAKMRPMMNIGLLVSCASILIFSFMTSFISGMLSLALGSMGLVMFLANGNAVAQTLPPTRIRGRIISMWMWIWGGTLPLGALYMGYASEHWGPPAALQAGVLITLAAFGVIECILFLMNKRNKVV